MEEILRYCEEFFPGEPPEYFFDRNPENFPAILDMYRSVRNYYYYYIIVKNIFIAPSLSHEINTKRRPKNILIVSKNIFILKFMQGMFHMSEGGCALVLQKDLEYWSIDELTMEPCCALKYYPQIDVCQSEKDGDIAAKKLEMELANEEDFGSSCIGQVG